MFDSQNDRKWVEFESPTVHDILTEKQVIQKICAKLVPKNLTNGQKENLRNVCLDLPERIENESIFNVIKGEESWFFH